MDHFTTEQWHLNQRTLVVILGGGRGNRLFPLTKMRSKPAVPIAGKYRLIDIPISNCIHSGLNRIFVLTQFNSASLNQHIARTYNFDAFSSGFTEVLAAEQTVGSEEWFQGTADAVRKVYPHITHQTWDYLIILSGDHLYRMNYLEFLTHHIKHKADVSVGVIGVAEEHVSEFGLLKIDNHKRIVEFKEKPKSKQEYEPFRTDTVNLGMDSKSAIKKPFLASMGIYVFNHTVMKDILFGNETHNDFGTQIIPSIVNKYKVQAYLFNGYWEDIGTIRAFFESNLALCGTNPPFQLFHPSRPIFTRQRYLAGSFVIDSHIQKSIINDGCMIKNSTIVNSVIGIRSYLDEGTHIEGSLIMGADYYNDPVTPKHNRIGIGKNSRIVKAIVDKNASIGQNVVLENTQQVQNFDDPEERLYIRDGIIIVPKGSRLPDNFKLNDLLNN